VGASAAPLRVTPARPLHAAARRLLARRRGRRRSELCHRGRRLGLARGSRAVLAPVAGHRQHDPARRRRRSRRRRRRLGRDLPRHGAADPSERGHARRPGQLAGRGGGVCPQRPPDRCADAGLRRRRDPRRLPGGARPAESQGIRSLARRAGHQARLRSADARGLPHRPDRRRRSVLAGRGDRPLLDRGSRRALGQRDRRLGRGPRILDAGRRVGRPLRRLGPVHRARPPSVGHRAGHRRSRAPEHLRARARGGGQQRGLRRPAPARERASHRGPGPGAERRRLCPLPLGRLRLGRGRAGLPVHAGQRRSPARCRGGGPARHQRHLRSAAAHRLRRRAPPPRRGLLPRRAPGLPPGSADRRLQPRLAARRHERHRGGGSGTPRRDRPADPGDPRGRRRSGRRPGSAARRWAAA
ncbi:MAG: hypothetical protein AVDCRST_MAG45-2537, partial [uncultured Solirubrobacterales bacterium]